MPLPVVIVSGLGAPHAAAVAYGRQVFETRGFRCFAAPQRLLGYGDLRIATDLVHDEVLRVLALTGAPKVHLVGMSLGGLIGLYYVKCRGGDEYVERFVSIGGPLNGSSLARLVELLPMQAAHALTQTTPDNSFMRELQAAPNPKHTRMFSIGTHGDLLTPRSSWDAAGCEPIETPYGCFPIGHWTLFLHPGNHKVVVDCLTKD